MRHKLQTILLIFCILYSFTISAQENILYFLQNTPQSNYLNPAHRTDESKVVINLPILSGFDFTLSNSFSMNDLADIGNNQLVIDLDKFYSNIPRVNYLSEVLAIPVFDLQIRTKKRTYSFGIIEHQLIRSGFDNNLVRLINEGNYPWIGSNFSTDFDFNFLHYREYALGYSQNIGSKISIGARVKLLSGMSIFDTRQMNLGIETGSNMEFLLVNASGEYNVCMPFMSGLNNTDSTNTEAFNMVNYLTKTNNTGFAFDLGVCYKVLPKLEVSASLLNLGFINWKTDARVVSHSGSFNWQGFNLSNIENDANVNEEPYKDPFQSITDSVSNILNFNSEEKSFTSGIPTRIYIAANYEVAKFFNAGLVEQLMIYDQQLTNSLTISGNLKLGSVFSLSAGYSIIDNSYDNLSLGTALKLGPIQIYCLTDNILALNVLKSQNFNVRFGINFMFGRISNKDEQ